ncbi:hypothetical protein VP1G_10625 [Cytospora mali]|uniref:Uncharacterized protein n=1 Tax=Cytospora mali TaxID=578113 RepID=A0A194UQE9_CYTMA|nr:hypothetical protein VP1G_10625 [Valsa mali var. pyri (nom. inval.)]
MSRLFRSPQSSTPKNAFASFLGSQDRSETAKVTRLLRCALDTLGMWVTVLIVLVHRTAIAKCSSSSVRDVDCVRRWQKLAKGLESLGIFCPVLFGELDSELDVKVAEVVMTLDLAVVQKVVIFPGEAGVRLLLNLENDVAGHYARGLVTLATELNASTALDTTVDIDVKNLSVHNSLLSAALLAAILVLDDLTLTVTVRASGLEALDHRTHLSHHSLHTVSITASTFANSALLASATLALGADDGALKCQLRDLSAVDILERNLVGMVNCASLGRAPVWHTTAEHATQATAKATTTTKELSEQILSSHAAAASCATLQACLTILVVDLALLGVGQDFVGVRNLFELVFGLGVVGVLV